MHGCGKMSITVYTLFQFLVLSLNVQGEFYDNSQQNPFEYEVANTSQGGIEAEADLFYNDDHSDASNPLKRTKRMITNVESAKWPNGVVPYIFVDNSSIIEYKRIMALFEDNLCLHFVPWNETINEQLGLGHPGHLKFRKGSGCVTVLGLRRTSRGQNIYCCGGTNCVHEIGHILGMYHEQNNPQRDGWIRDNPENIWPSKRHVFKKGTPSGKEQRFPYDLSTTLNYQSWMFSVGGPSLTVLFPELKMTLDYYYMFMEIAWAYKCNELEPCNNMKLTCENDGFQTSVHGKCTCKCPTGLDPDTGCSLPLKKVSTTWPTGQYALPATENGCPDDTVFKLTKEGSNTITEKMRNVCPRTDEINDEDEEKYNWPVGIYCIYMNGEKCPTGSAHYNDGSPEIMKRSADDGGLPKGGVLIQFCCQYKGFTKDPAIFPTMKPFALFRSGKTCQQVTGMHVRTELTRVNSNSGGEFKLKGRFSHYINTRLKILYLHVCHYTPADTDCGAGIVLNKTHPETIIETNSTGRVDVDCVWIVRGEHGNGTLVLDFEEFDVGKTNGKCVDKVEVNHAMIGAAGLTYCGEKIRHSIRSITNKMLVRFMTVGSSTSSFKAKIRWVPNDELCYDAESRGVDYNGKINYTRMFKPCLPWSQVTKCHHHTFNKGDELDNLEGNYCRNPDNSFRPWCYTDVKGCKRNYCDVCKLERPYDQIDYCDKLKDNGFCIRDAAKAVEYCANICHDLLPNTGQINKYTEIECDPPTTPDDGVIIGEKKNKYGLGDKVEFKCNRGPSIVTTTCMTSGDWSPIVYACLECPLDYAVYENVCYGLIKEGKTFTKGDAETECRNIGGVIRTPKHHEESNVIDSVRRKKSIWMSATDIDQEGTWVYEDGTNITWKNWQDGQPNNYNNQDCLVMRGYQKWTDDPCTSYRMAVVCAIPKLDLSSDCPHNYAVYSNLCYGLIRNGKSFTKPQAEKECENRGGFINTPQSPEESNVIDSIRRDKNIWLSANDIVKEGKWVYKDGSNIIWSNWKYGRPTTMCNENDCVVMGKEQKWSCGSCRLKKNGVVCAIPVVGKDLLGHQCTRLLKDRPTSCQDFPDYVRKYCAKACGVRQGQGHAIECQIQLSDNNVEASSANTSISVGEVVTYGCSKSKYKNQGDDARVCQPDGMLNGNNLKCGDCPIGYTLVNNACYGLVEARTFTFIEARKECTKVGGFVASPKDQAENDLISSLGLGQSVWIGVTDIDVEQMFVLEDGSHVTWHNWANGKPKKDRRLDCTMMKQNKEWTNIGCSSIKLGTVCAIPKQGRTIQGSGMCYDPSDKGTTYNGNVYYTNTYQYCVPWTEVTNCPHHSFNPADARHNLEANYCRNPDNSLRPWCYTDGHKCRKSYCNVCDIELPADKADDCEIQKKEGVCKSHVTKAIRECATTCKGQLPSIGPVNNYIDIRCDRPTLPADGEIVGMIKEKYKLGDVLSLKCKRNKVVVNTTCLTSGEWSFLGLVCSECPLGYLLFNGSCYGFIDKMLTYTQAQEECGNVGGNLPMPKSSKENDFLSTIQNGKYIWLGADDVETEGTFIWNDGSNMEWNNWEEIKPNERDDCVILKPNKKWDDSFCDFTWSEMGVICSVAKLDDVPCQDFLQNQCNRLLMSKPTMCGEFKEFSEVFCAKTCGICGAKNISCSAQSSDPKVSSSVTTLTVPVGRYVKYKCDDNYYPYQGDHIRACQSDGELTGLPIKCKYSTLQVVVVGSTTLKKGPYVIPPTVAFSGENDQLRIKHDGTIEAWEFYSHSPIETSFQVWRKSDENNYSLVGQNVIITGNDIQQRYEVPKEYRINVKKDDLLGIWNAEKGGIHFDKCDSNLHPKWNGVSWSKRHSSASFFHVGAVEKFSIHPSCVQFFFRAEIIVRNLDTDIFCDDFLDRQCPIQLNNEPTMCKVSTKSSKMLCAKTCGFCGGKGIICSVQPADSRVSVSTTEPTVPVGNYVKYRCKDDDFVSYLGNATRACQSNGELTGTELVCRNKSSIERMIVGSGTLKRGDRVIPPRVAFTGENDQLRIKHDGQIVAWDFYSHSPIETSFMVWRNINANQYRLIGQNILLTGNNVRQRYEVPKEQQIKVKKGDLIGIWNSKEGGIHFNACDPKVNPKWSGVSWSNKRSSPSDFNVGTVEKFKSDSGCCHFFFNAEITVIE